MCPRNLSLRSSFSCNRVRTVDVKKWVIKEFDNVPVPGQHLGVFYSSEAYVIRWGYQISVGELMDVGVVGMQGLILKRGTKVMLAITELS